MIRHEFGGDIVTLHEIGSVENDDFADIRMSDYRLSDLEYRRSAKRLRRFFFPNLMILILAAKK